MIRNIADLCVSSALFTLVLMPVRCPWICLYLVLKMEVFFHKS